MVRNVEEAIKKIIRAEEKAGMMELAREAQINFSTVQHYKKRDFQPLSVQILARLEDAADVINHPRWVDPHPLVKQRRQRKRIENE
jgi:hypothetical protein